MRVPDADEISIHDLRRTASSIMSAKGQDKIDIQHVIGHSEGSEITEDVYIKSHFYPALKAVQALDSALDEYKMNSSLFFVCLSKLLAHLLQFVYFHQFDMLEIFHINRYKVMSDINGYF